jgi:Putative prokaryotic signal transducing protein
VTDTFVQAHAVVAFDVGSRAMTLIKTYDTRLEADLASIRLHAEGITSTVVGVGLSMEGGAGGVRLLVPDEQVEAARELLADL